MRKKVDLEKVDDKKIATLFDAPKLKKTAHDSKLVKGVESLHLINQQTITITDISLSSKGPLEDHVFASDIDLHHNIRRGLSVITFPDKRVEICRRGLKKFFDIQFEDLEPNANITNKVNRILRRYTLSEIEAQLLIGNTITVMQLEKANGENAQVSFNKELNSWIICSKNVALPAQKEEDLSAEIFKNSRYNFAVLIAKVWFQKLKTLDAGQIGKLKEVLSQHTFVGEYCGNPAYQHLVPYNHIQLRFYAMVQNISDNTCVLPLKAYQVFNEFGLDCVKYVSFKASDLVEFFKLMKQIYKNVGASSVEQEGEGAVVYFMDEKQMFTLGKVKTIEYRLFRKLREKLKNMLSKHQPVKDILKKYSNECAQLQLEALAFKPQEYYDMIAEKAFTYIDSFIEKHKNKEEQIKKQKNFIASKYIDFLDIVKNEKYSQQQLNAVLIDELFKWEEEENESDEEIQEQKPLQQKQPSEPQVEETKNQDIVQHNPQDVKKDKKKNKTQKILIIYPLTIPASGKTVFLKCLETILKDKINQGQEESKDGAINNQDIKYYNVSIDKIRKSIIDKELKNPENQLTREQLFKQLYKDANNQYDCQINRIIADIQERQHQKALIFLDKNYTVGGYQQQKKQFKLLDNKSLIDIALVPKCAIEFPHYPFSLSYLIQCLQRALLRKDHETMVGSDHMIAGVVLISFAQFQNIQNPQSNFHKFIEFSFTEDQQVEKETQTFFHELLTLAIDEKSWEKLASTYPQKLEQCIKIAREFKQESPTYQAQEDQVRSIINKII